MTPRILPYGRQSIDQEDLDAVLAALGSDFLTQGPAVERFEAALAEACGTRYAVAVASGTAALHIAGLAIGLQPGDAVIVPAITFAATANAVLYAGATPVFADIDSETLGLCPESAERAIALAETAGLRPRALFPVHYAGRPCQLERLAGLAKAKRLRLVEDACHALGAQYRLQGETGFHHVGSGPLADLACWSFHPVKHVTTAEGGAVTTDDAQTAKLLRLLRSHGITKDPADFTQPEFAYDDGELNPWYHEMQVLGFNYRLSDLQAALGISQVGKLERFVSARRAHADHYRRTLGELPHVVLPPGDADTARHSYHLFPLQVAFDGLGRSRREVMAALRARGVGSQVHYLPVYRHPYYQRHQERWLADACPNAERFYARALSIPLYPDLGPEDLQVVSTACREVLGGR